MKKILSVIIAVIMIMVLSLMSMTAFAAEPDREYGDVDGNGVIEVRDYILTMLTSLGKQELTPAEFTAADIDGDGIITEKDAAYIRNDIYEICLINELYQPGDVDGNGEINTVDYIVLRLHLLGIQELVGRQYEGADVNRDGKVDDTDYITLRLQLLGIL